MTSTMTNARLRKLKNLYHPTNYTTTFPEVVTDLISPHKKQKPSKPHQSMNTSYTYEKTNKANKSLAN
jgi:hypothetical protein